MIAGRRAQARQGATASALRTGIRSCAPSAADQPPTAIPAYGLPP